MGTQATTKFPFQPECFQTFVIKSRGRNHIRPETLLLCKAPRTGRQGLLWGVRRAAGAATSPPHAPAPGRACEGDAAHAACAACSHPPAAQQSCRQRLAHQQPLGCAFLDPCQREGGLGRQRRIHPAGSDCINGLEARKPRLQNARMGESGGGGLVLPRNRPRLVSTRIRLSEVDAEFSPAWLEAWGCAL